jgi:RHS repeat-associated protein
MMGGAKIASIYLLDNIVIKELNNIPFRTYRFQYGMGDLYSFLTEIEVEGNDGTKYNPTKFLYGNIDNGMDEINTGLFTNKQEKYSVGDFDGDGQSDLLAINTINLDFGNNVSYDKFSIYKKASPPNSIIPTFSVHSTVNIPVTTNTYNKRDYHNAFKSYSSDYDGDGDDDVLMLNWTNTGTGTEIDNITVHLSENNATSFSTSYNSVSTIFPHSGITPFGIPVGNTQPYRFFWDSNKEIGNFLLQGDFDGNGAVDFITLLDFSGASGVYGAMATFNSISTSEQHVEIEGFYYNVYNYYDNDIYSTLDFNGNGKTDVMVRTSIGQCIIYEFTKGLNNNNRVVYKANILFQAGYPTVWHTVMTGDFNGDGKTDLLTRSNDISQLLWEVAYSTGEQFDTHGIIFPHNPAINTHNHSYVPNPSDDKLTIADFNGDGKSDILVEYQKTVGSVISKIKNMLYFRSNLQTGALLSGVNYKVETFSTNGYISPGWNLVGDFNGDGKADYFDRGAIPVDANFVYFGANNNDRLLRKVINGIGHVTEYKYEYLTKGSSFYTKDVSSATLADNTLNNVQPPMIALKSVSTPDGIGGFFETTFKYEGLKLHKKGLGLLGFRKIISNNINANTRIETEAQLDNTYFVMKNFKTKTFNTITNLCTEISENTDIITVVPNSNGSYKKENAEVKKTNGFSGAVTKTIRVYDNFGNVTTETVNTGTLVSATTNSTYGAFGGVVPNRPTYVIELKNRAGSPQVSKHTSLEYDTKGQLVKKINYPNLPLWNATSFVYNSFGNVVSNSTTGAGASFVSTTNSNYDALGRNLKNSYNPLGQVETFYYYPQNHLVYKISNALSLMTAIYYDGFDKPYKSISYDPNGGNDLETNTGLLWLNQGNNIKYASVSITTNSPPIVSLFDLLGRVVSNRSTEFNNNIVVSDFVYDAKGKLSKQSKPFFLGSAPSYITMNYDSYGRLTSTNDPIAGMTHKSYNYSGVDYIETTTMPNGRFKKLTYDWSGKLMQSSENNTTLVSYKYDSWGNEIENKVNSSPLVNFSANVDPYGRINIQVDANAGTKSVEFNSLGEITKATNANGHVSEYVYDIMGRVIERVGVEGITQYEYYPAIDINVNKLKKIIGFNGITEAFKYNADGLIEEYTKVIDNINYVIRYSYNALDRLETKYYLNSGIKINYEYDQYGFLLSVKDANNNTIYQPSTYNSYGQIVDYTLGNNLLSTNAYNENYLLKKETPNVQDYEIMYDYTASTILKREDNLNGLSEIFTYDNFDRLKSSSVTGQQAMTTSYTSNGNIQKKSDKFGNDYLYTYQQSKTNAVDKIINLQNPLICPPDHSPSLQQISYTTYDMPERITEDNWVYSLSYGPDYSRAKSHLINATNSVFEKHYINDMEVEIQSNGTKYIHYINTDAGLVSMIVVDNGSESYYSTYTDHLGSIVVLTDQNANMIAQQNFDAWGRKRNVNNWSYNNVQSVPDWLKRGFTGHEHLDEFKLVNMNARLYDPLNGRMLSPDKFVQDPTNMQNLNRFSYALNNPLSVTDPTGNLLAAMLWAVTYFGELGANIQHGESHPGKKAYRTTNNHVQEVGNLFQYTIDEDENYRLSAGINILSLGVGINFSGQVGNLGLNAGVGFGVGGFDASGGASLHYNNIFLYVGGSTDLHSGRLSFGGGYNKEGGLRFMYFENKYCGKNSQNTGTISAGFGEFGVTEENDFLALKNSSDKFRTQALEFQAGTLTFGIPIYTNDPAGEVKDAGEINDPKKYRAPGKSARWGEHKSKDYTSWGEFGKALYSAAYVGYRQGNIDSRIGISDKRIQDFFQNGAHQQKWFPAANQNFYLNYTEFQSGLYLYNGFSNPASLYGN